MTEHSTVEKVVIFVVDSAFTSNEVEQGLYKSLDNLSARGQCGFVSTFTDSNDTISQLIGTHYFSPEKLSEELGPMKLAVLVDKSSYNANFGDKTKISGMSTEQIADLINKSFSDHSVIVCELGGLKQLDEIVGKLLPGIDGSNHAICALIGYADGVKVPTFPTPPVVDPSWKVIGPDVVGTLSVEHPMMFITASKQLTRVDNVRFFGEKEVEDNCGMGCLPICQLFKEFSYYTGSTWKYGA